MAKTKRQILNELLSPIVDNKRSGKTTLLKMGVDNYDKPFALIARTIESGKEITRNPNCIVITPRSLDALKGFKGPIIYDQEFFYDYVQQVLEEIDEKCLLK
jgi:hypothetical protein